MKLFIEKYKFHQNTMDELLKVMKHGEKHGCTWMDITIVDHFLHGMGHAFEWRGGKVEDDDSKAHPLAHVVVRMMMALDNELNGGTLDDDEENEE